MPLYDYECGRCGGFRAFKSMSESGAPAACPGCGAGAARVLSAPFLGGAPAAGWLARPHGGGVGRRGGGWRAACGLGCNHANCR